MLPDMSFLAVKGSLIKEKFFQAHDYYVGE